MSLLNTNSVSLQRIDGVDKDKVLIELSRSNLDCTACATTYLTLHIDKQGHTATLDFDPWSDINVIPDGSIDEKDVEAITDLAVAFYRQTTLGPELKVTLKALDNLPGAVRVSIGLFEMDEDTDEWVAHNHFYTATSVDHGINFSLFRVTRHGGSHLQEDCDLTPMLQAFVKMKV